MDLRSLHRPFAGLCAAVLLALPAQADAPHDLFTLALNRIDSVYLWRNTLDPVEAFAAAGRQLEEEVEWVMVERDGPTLTLRHGDGPTMGSATVTGWDDLPDGLRDIESLVESDGAELRDGLDLQVVLLKGVADALDRHSRILHGQKLKSFDKRLKGTISGIGARVGIEDHQIIIRRVYAETPAEREGLQAGDRVMRIDGVSTVGMVVRDAVDRITGERGSALTLQIERDVEIDGQTVVKTRAFDLVREEIKIPNLSWEPLEDDQGRTGVGYIEIDHFSEQTVANLRRALQELSDQGALDVGLVLDLRGNTGGSMIQSARSADQFLRSGELVRTVGRDGGPVSGLVSSIKAIEDDSEPDVPVVILQDHRTASGSEIVAGALRELDRTVLIGTRSYGKGTVQKVYTLRPDTRMKLTVAEYLLPGDLSIRDVGLTPDLPVGTLRFDDRGVSFSGASLQSSGATPLLFIDERAGWRSDATPESRGDTVKDLAVRLLHQARGAEREVLLEDLADLRQQILVEEEARLVEAFSARGLDWSPSPGIPELPGLDVQIELLDADGQPLASQPTGPATAGAASARSGQEVQIRARVENRSDQTLHRLMVHLDSPDSAWDDAAIPIGLLAPGEAREGTRTVSIPGGRHARESSVEVEVALDGRAPLAQAPVVLGYDGDPDPPMAVALALGPQPAEGDARQVQLDLQHLGDEPLSDVRVRFEYPEDASVELTEYDVRLDALASGDAEQVTLGLRVLEGAAQELPLHVIVEADGYGEVLDWPVDLPQSGQGVALQAPRVSAPDRPTRAPAGPLTLDFRVVDERAVDHVVVWGAAGKLAYASGDGPELDVSVPITIEEGRNRIVVYATDDQDVRRKEVWYIHGDAASAADAGGE